MGKIVRGTVRGGYRFASEQPTVYDSIINKLLKFDSKGGSIDEEKFVDELCKMHGIKKPPKVRHLPKAPIDEKGRVIAGQYYSEKDEIIIYDDANGPICEYADTMAHEMQHASDHEKGLAIEEPIAYREGDEAQYACEKKESETFIQQKNSDASFSSDFGMLMLIRMILKG